MTLTPAAAAKPNRLSIPVKPSLQQPNQELTIAEIPLTSTPFASHAPLPVPGSTSPVKVDAPIPAKQLPQTASRDTGESAARVISMSQQRIEQGTAALPVVNEIAEAEQLIVKSIEVNERIGRRKGVAIPSLRLSLKFQ